MKIDFTTIRNVFDLLADPARLEAALAEMTPAEREVLYTHPLMDEYDLLP